MPPRYAYWTIIAGGLPTAFRAADREDLLPTFARIRQKHPDAQLKWFARGRLWDSPESARTAQKAPPRGRDWRPGGTHQDPRQPYRDAKKARNAAHRKRKFDRRERSGGQRDDRRPPSAPARRGPRVFERKVFVRSQRKDDPSPAPPPEAPGREPRPREGSQPSPPPRPSEPVIQPPGPPERGRGGKPRRPKR